MTRKPETQLRTSLSLLTIWCSASFIRRVKSFKNQKIKMMTFNKCPQKATEKVSYHNTPSEISDVFSLGRDRVSNKNLYRKLKTGSESLTHVSSNWCSAPSIRPMNNHQKKTTKYALLKKKVRTNTGGKTTHPLFYREAFRF